MPSIKRPHILYVEDDRDLALLVRERLSQSEIVVDLAHDGEETLAKFACPPYDLLALDQTLPGRDGLDVLRALAARGPLPPTIMVTGTGNERVAVETMKLGADDYIIKDLDGGWLDLLPGVVERVLGHRKLADEKKAAETALREREQQLWRAQKLESLGVLASGIAHDFNNILAGIMGYADLIRLRLAPTDPARQDLDVIKKAVQRAADLTRQLLAYAGRGKLVVEAVDLSRVVDDARKMLDVALSKKAVVTYNLAAGLPSIQADISQIHQILLNLVINASEALGERSGLIAISTDTAPLSDARSAGLRDEDQPDQEPCVCLTVSDTGCGMDEEMLGRIFDPFFTTKLAGRGLGLASVHGIVCAHHGAIRVRSTLGSGTTFQVYFPANGSSTTAAQGESAVQPWRGTGCVLVVDDEVLVRQSAQRMVEEAGFAVLTAHDGEEAVRVFREHFNKITCVLLDLTMPKMDGAETYHELRRIHPGVRVILSSGCGEDWAKTRIAGMGWAGFIQKPYQYAEMVARLKEAWAAPAHGRRGEVPT